MRNAAPQVAIVLGSKSDWETVAGAAETLEALGVAHEVRVLSAHRTPDQLAEYVGAAEQRGLKVLIAAAGGAAHLAGVIAARTLLPVLGVPIQSPALSGLDALLSIVQMPAGVPVGTLAIGSAGAINAALLAAEILALSQPDLRQKLHDYRQRQREATLAEADPRRAKPQPIPGGGKPA